LCAGLLQATNADTIWSLADRLDVDAVALLANNSVAITDPTAPLGGKLITLCAAGGCFVETQVLLGPPVVALLFLAQQ
jgi:hypothetical protein